MHPQKNMPDAAASLPMIHPSIFREYDIRGIVGETLRLEDAPRLARAYGTFVRSQGARTIALGYDGRTTSPLFADAIAGALADDGLNVALIGMGPTPMLSFAIRHLNTDGGIMVTGSHNPAGHNGLKLTGPGGSLYGDQIQALRALINTSSAPAPQKTGTITRHDVAAAYLDRLVSDYQLKRPLRVVWDCGNGASGDLIQQLVTRLPGVHHVLFGDVDGTFPNHHPDPTVDANLTDLITTVRTHQADLGIAFDGDGDRIGAVDGKGRILRCDVLLALYARAILEQHPGATIVGDIKCSSALFNDVRAHGGRPIIWKTGHSLIKAKLKETGAPLAGELSGHIFFADTYYGFDDGLYAAVRLLNLLETRSLADLHDTFPPMINTPEIRFDVPESDKFPMIDQLKTHLRTQAIPFNDIDGVRVETAQGWWLLRASNTQNALVARIEADSDAALASLRGMMAQCLAAAGIPLHGLSTL